MIQDRDNPRPPVLLFVFADDDQFGRPLRELRRELEEARAALLSATQRGLCEIVVRNSTTPSVLVEVLEDARYRDRIVGIHFAGHANTAGLQLESERDGLRASARASGIVGLLTDLDHLLFVVLNGCNTSAIGTKLVEAGVPAVVVTDDTVPDDIARRFATAIYRNLADGVSLHSAFNRARSQIDCFQYEPASALRDLAGELASTEPELPWRILWARDPRGAKDWNLHKAEHAPLLGLPRPDHGVLPPRPFRGLHRFSSADSSIFFGRDRSIRDLYDRIVDPLLPSLLVVHGAAGVGKSSLLHAGLIPHLRVKHWVGSACLAAGQRPEAILAGLLEEFREAGGLAERWLAAEAKRGQPVFLCLDQLETLVMNATPRRALADLAHLLEGVFGGSRRPRGKLILGLRKEWFSELRTALQVRQIFWDDYFVQSLSRNDIIDVVTGPTRTASVRARYGVELQEGLAERIADELTRDNSAVVAPVLQILLTRMWDIATAGGTTERGTIRRRFTHATFERLRLEGLGLADFVKQQLETFEVTHSEPLRSGLVLDILYHHTSNATAAVVRGRASLMARYASRPATTAAILGRCVDLFLLQHVGSTVDGGDGFRLAHDTLAPIVHRLYTQSKAAGPVATGLLDARMSMGEGTERPPSLGVHDLKRVVAGRSGMRDWSLAERRLIRRSQAARWWRNGVRSAAVVAGAVSVGRVVVNSVESLEPAAITDSAVEHGPSPKPTAMPKQEPSLGPPSPIETIEKTAKRCRARTWSIPSESAESKVEAAVSPDGEFVALGHTEEDDIWVVPQHSTKVSDVSPIDTHGGVKALVWSPDSDHLVVAQAGGHLTLGNTRGRPALECGGPGRGIGAVAFAGNGHRFMAVDLDGEATLWSFTEMECRATATASLDYRVGVATPGRENQWLFAGEGGRLTHWRPTSPAVTVALSSAKAHRIWQAQPTATPGIVVTSGQRLVVWRERTVAADKSLTRVARHLVVVAGGELIVTASTREVHLWQVDKGTLAQVGTPAKPEAAIVDVAAGGDGHRELFVVLADGRVLWLSVDGTALVQRGIHDVDLQDPNTIVVDPLMRYVVAGGGRGQSAVVDLPVRSSTCALKWGTAAKKPLLE